MSKILLVEDDTMISSGITYALELEGYEVICGRNKNEAFNIINREDVDLAILDLQLPDGTGFEVFEKLKGTGTAVIFLTVVDDENTIVKAFDGGAEDYIVKPFRIRELLARVKRVTNSLHNQNSSANEIMIGKVIINVDEAKVYVGSETIDLTALEYRLLLIFANNKGILLTREKILEKIWDIDGNYVEDNTLTVYVKRLREKLHGAINIETVRGMGYRVDK
ncbi:MAG: response regulator transcription factor [Lachnospiraceae bacterium]|nr:response regulator transcription factor [Lachnospiraceae bacterium]